MAKNIYQIFKSDRDKIDPQENIWNLQNQIHQKGNKTGYYQKEKLKKYKSDVHNNRENTVVAKIVLTKNININYDKSKKLADFNDRNCGFFMEAIEIISNNKNVTQYTTFGLTKNGNEDNMCRRGER